MLLKLIKQSLTNSERFSVLQDTSPKIVFKVDLQPLEHGVELHTDTIRHPQAYVICMGFNRYNS